MPMRLEGSCRCGAISFSVDSHTPYPYQRCYCSICRKSAGGGGYAIFTRSQGKKTDATPFTVARCLRIQNTKRVSHAKHHFPIGRPPGPSRKSLRDVH